MSTCKKAVVFTLFFINIGELECADEKGNIAPHASDSEDDDMAIQEIMDDDDDGDSDSQTEVNRPKASSSKTEHSEAKDEVIPPKRARKILKYQDFLEVTSNFRNCV